MADSTKVVKTLPTWDEAKLAMDKNEYTALHEFIYNWEPGFMPDGKTDSDWRRDLAELVRDIFASGIEVGIEHQKRNTEPK